MLSADISAVVEGPGATPEPLTATFGDVPSEHTGQAFTFGLAFSEEVEISYETLRDDAFEVTGGSVTTASRTAPPSNQEWAITVEPASSSDTVAITLPETTDCGAAGAICTGGDDPRPLSNSPSHTVAGAAAVPEPLTATFGDDMPASHTGETFTFGLSFSEELASDFSYKTLRDDAFSVTGGSVKNASRRTQGSNLAWNITVEPASTSATVTITLPETTDCAATGAICTEDGRALSHSLSATVNAASASASAAANGDGDAEDDALALVAGVTPDEAAQALFGERRLSEARLDALDLLGNGNGRYDLGDLLSWIERCRQGEASCGSVPTDPGPVSGAALLAAGAVGRRGSSRRPNGAIPGAADAHRGTRQAPPGGHGRIRARHAARRHDLVVCRRCGRAGRRRAGSGLPDRGSNRARRQSRHRRAAGAGRPRHRNRAGSRSRVVPIHGGRAASDRRGGLAHGGSPRAVRGAGPRPASSVPGPRPAGHGRGLRAEGTQGTTGP